MLIIIHFIIKYKIHVIVTLRSRGRVPWRLTMILFFNVTFYTLMHFDNLTSFQNYWFKSSIFFKMEFCIHNHVNKIQMKQVQFFVNSRTLHVNVVQWLFAESIDIKYICPLCLDILCHEKQVICTWLIFLYSNDVFSKSLWHFLPMLLKILNLCNEKGPLPNVIFNTLHFKNSLKNLKKLWKSLQIAGFATFIYNYMW